MKRIITLAVELRNLSNFQWHPGAEEFAKEYSNFQSGFFYFNFDLDQQGWQAAEEQLKTEGLAYKVYYKLELEDVEIKDYQAFNLTIPALCNLITTSPEGNFSLNRRELGDLPMAEDFGSNLLVFSDLVWTVLQSFSATPELVFERSMMVSGAKYYLSKLPLLADSPLIVLGEVKVKADADSSKTYYPDGVDDRFDLAPEGISFLHEHHLVTVFNFEYQGTTYQKKVPNFLISGALAFELHKVSKEFFQITPLTLKQI